MNQEKAVIIKMVSHLLQYPDELLHQSGATLRQLLEELPSSRAREILVKFLNYQGQRPLLSLQEEYSRHFDLNPATCLNLTYHRYGDAKARGAALADLRRLYLQAGYLPMTTELPDYLPLVLEFLSICPQETYSWLVQEYQPQIENLAQQLDQAGTPYADLLSVAAASLRE